MLSAVSRAARLVRLEMRGNKKLNVVLGLAPGLRERTVPRLLFLGLCSVGAVVGVPAGSYIRPNLPNQKHAVAGLELLRERGDVFESGLKLWRTLGLTQHHDYQMDVLLALWRAGLLRQRVQCHLAADGLR